MAVNTGHHDVSQLHAQMGANRVLALLAHDLMKTAHIATRSRLFTFEHP
jgi:hypothetical protein